MSRYNDLITMLVVNTATELNKFDPTGALQMTVGVLTAYNAQLAHYEAAKANMMLRGDVPNLDRIHFLLVDKAQGEEYDIVILKTTDTSRACEEQTTLIGHG